MCDQILTLENVYTVYFWLTYLYVSVPRDIFRIYCINFRKCQDVDLTQKYLNIVLILIC